MWAVGGEAFKLPGVGPKDWTMDERVEVQVGSMESVLTQAPMNYYDLHVCVPPEGLVQEVSSLGEVLVGEVLQNTAYQVFYRKTETCKQLCKVELTPDEVVMYKQRIADQYRIHWQADYMYSLMRTNTTQDRPSDSPALTFGMALGVEDQGRVFANNHAVMTIQYHTVATNPHVGRIVGFQVQPYSIQQWTDDSGQLHCEPATSSAPPLPPVDLTHEPSVVFSYDVIWEESETPWSSRFGIYWKRSHDMPMIRWFSIVNSLVVVLLLSAVVAMILVRALYRDIARYNQMLAEEDDGEETGWKLVHADVFRKPPHSTVLAALTGSGVQILAMVVVTVACATVGVFSVSYRGRVLQSMIVLWAALGGLGGYASAKFYKMFRSPNWKLTTIRTSVLFPGVVFSVFFLLNLVMHYEGSSAAVPFGALVMLLLLWFAISIPLVFLGAYFGYKAPAISLPLRVNKIPRQIPSQSWFMGFTTSCMVGGALPFGAMFTELLFLFSSIWQHRFYYLFGFLFLVLIILIITCAEIAIALIYFQLVCEDYNWWWRSFCVSATSGVYVFLYSIYYFYTRLRLSRLSAVLLYFGYSFVIAYAFAILTGSIGFIACFFFLRQIYASIKVD